MPTITVRYWAAAKQAAGVAEEKVSAQTLAELIAAVVDSRRGGDRSAPGAAAPGSGAEALAAVLARSSFLVNGEQAGRRAPELVQLGESAVVEVLPPFAGG